MYYNKNNKGKITDEWIIGLINLEESIKVVFELIVIFIFDENGRKGR